MSSRDPYTEKASKDASLDDKVNEVKEIMKAVKAAMLTTRAQNGDLHSRCMAPASTSGLVIDFIANNESGKFDEVEHDPKVNVNFYDPSSTNWISLAGEAKVVNDKSEIEKLWNPVIKAWFGDLGDGKHTGNFDDPRVSAIKVQPTEIRYWYARSKIGQAYEVAKGAATGETAAPGALRTITQQELSSIKE